MKNIYLRNSIVESLELAIEDLKIEKEFLKGAFFLGYLISKIEYRQKERGLTGSISKELYRKIRNENHMKTLYNKVSELILIKYTKDLGYLKPTLHKTTEFLNVSEDYKFNKDETTFYLVSGYMLANNIRVQKLEKEEI